MVYVETPVDTAGTGQTDIVKLSILRPHFDGKIPAVITNSPYHQGVNDVASDKALHKMEGELAEKQVGTIQVKQASITKLDLDQRNLPVSPATENWGTLLRTPSMTTSSLAALPASMCLVLARWARRAT